MLLEAAQERGEPRSAPDRDDPRAAGEEPLLVDHLDERLVLVADRNGAIRTLTTVRAEREEPDADDAEDQRPEPRQELQGHEVETTSGPARRGTSRKTWRKTNAPEATPSSPMKTTAASA